MYLRFNDEYRTSNSLRVSGHSINLLYRPRDLIILSCSVRKAVENKVGLCGYSPNRWQRAYLSANNILDGLQFETQVITFTDFLLSVTYNVIDISFIVILTRQWES